MSGVRTMPGPTRRLQRFVRRVIPNTLSVYLTNMPVNHYAGGGIHTLPLMEQPIVPKHIPFPNIPLEDELCFELFIGGHAIICMLLQYLHLYRSVWWVPYSFTRQAVNFYLIDIYLIIFIVVVVTRRFFYTLGLKFLMMILPDYCHQIAKYCYRCLCFIGFCFLLSWSAYYVMLHHPVVNILYLGYPMIIYLILFGIHCTPFFELTSWNSYTPLPIHACSSSPGEIRKEVDWLKGNFNNRLKQILFCSMINAYYAGFIPCCFAPSTLNYEIYWAAQHVLFIFLTSFIAFTVQILSLRYCDILHRSSLHLGNWDKLDARNMLLVNNNWKDDMLWPSGTLVRHGRDIYRALGECNASEPGTASFSRFYQLFRNPSYSFSVLLAFHVFVVIVQLGILIRCVVWHNILSLTFVLFFNDFVLYKLARNYLVCFRLYKDENAMHNKTHMR